LLKTLHDLTHEASLYGVRFKDDEGPFLVRLAFHINKNYAESIALYGFITRDFSE
jgi:hypothetical protein